MTDPTLHIIDTLAASLPPVIARKKVRWFLGGMVSPSTLCNADCRGQGPAGAFKVGETVMYPTPALLAWIRDRFGIKGLSAIEPLGLGSRPRPMSRPGLDGHNA